MKSLILLLLISSTTCFSQIIDSTETIKTLKKGKWVLESKDPNTFTDKEITKVKINFKKSGVATFQFQKKETSFKIKGSYEVNSYNSDTIDIYLHASNDEWYIIQSNFIVISLNKNNVDLKTDYVKGHPNYQASLKRKRLLTHR